jgi:hypothetical protein
MGALFSFVWALIKFLIAAAVLAGVLLYGFLIGQFWTVAAGILVASFILGMFDKADDNAKNQKELLELMRRKEAKERQQPMLTLDLD